MGVVELSRRDLLLKKHKSIVETRRHQEALVQTSRNVVTGSTDTLNNRKIFSRIQTEMAVYDLKLAEIASRKSSRGATKCNHMVRIL